MKARAPLLVASLAALALLLGGCAWSNRANRPVWNAFEANLVPADTGTFYATLPLTLPAGLICILVDSFIVHPAQIADDSWADAGDVWDDIDWEKHYYTQLVVLPVRVVGTPVVFVVMFLGRSLFDIPPHGSKPDRRGGRDPMAIIREDNAAERALLERLTVIAQAQPDSPRVRLTELEAPPEWSAELDRAYAEALARGRALDRLELYTYAQRHKLPPWRADNTAGLRDPDPVVRYQVLLSWPLNLDVPADLLAALQSDPNEAVRQLARHRWP